MYESYLVTVVPVWSTSYLSYLVLIALLSIYILNLPCALISVLRLCNTSWSWNLDLILKNLLILVGGKYFSLCCMLFVFHDLFLYLGGYLLLLLILIYFVDCRTEIFSVGCRTLCFFFDCRIYIPSWVVELVFLLYVGRPYPSLLGEENFLLFDWKNLLGGEKQNPSWYIGRRKNLLLGGGKIISYWLKKTLCWG